jgi:threonine dehydratase
MVAEGASVVGLAAVLAGKVTPEGPTGTIVTGRNLDMPTFARIMAGEDIRLGDILLKGRVYGA